MKRILPILFALILFALILLPLTSFAQDPYHQNHGTSTNFTGKGTVTFDSVTVGTPLPVPSGGTGYNRSPGVFYVKNGGNDSNAGTITAPWANAPGMINCSGVCASTTLIPGDSLLLSKGSTWRQEIIVSVSGASGQPIVYGAYGAGPQPIINPSTAVSSWTGSGVYTASIASTVNMLYEDTIPLTLATSSACSNGNWFWSGGTLYYKPTSGLSSNHVVGVSATYENGIDTSNQSYITINGINFVNAWIASNIFESGSSSGITFTNNTVTNSYNGIYWIFGASSTLSNCTISNNTFLNNATAISYDPNASGTGQAINIAVTNNIITGAGTTNGSVAWWTALNNTTADLAGIGIQNPVNNTITGNIITGGNNQCIVIYPNPNSIAANNTISYNYMANNQVNAVTANQNNAFAIGGAGNGGYNNNTFSYNIINNCGNTSGTSGTSRAAIATSQGSLSTSQNYIYNNVIYGGTIAMILYANSIPNYLTIKNNIITGQATYYFYSGYSEATLILDYNMYGSSSNSWWYWNGANDSWTTWQTVGDAHGVIGSPLFRNGSGSFSLATDFLLQATSTARTAAINVGLTLDYAGNPVPSVPDIGAFEFIPGVSGQGALPTDYLKWTIYSAQPYACSSTTEGGHAYSVSHYECFCDGTSWKQVSAPASACVW